MPTLTNSPLRISRRKVLASAAALPALAASPGLGATPKTDTFTYEVMRTENEWRTLLTDTEYFVMREGGTERPHTSLNAFEERDGIYRCKGCDLHAFDSQWKVPHFDIGWAFFSQSRPTTVLTSIDERFMAMGDDAPKATIECHCRRCGSHFGHILNVRGDVLHCLNGSAFHFIPS